MTFGRRHQVERWLALTATATPRTIEDITCKYSIQKTIISDVRLRDNIKITISRESDVLSAASHLIRSLPKDHSVIVFAAYQQQAQSLCDWLRAQGLASKCYHGKLTEQEKTGVQAAFNSGLARILVTTLAFGMGIDKANIRSVVHLTLPKSIEQFIQESGRAGRDGEASWSHIFLAKEQYYTFQGYIVAEFVTPRCVQQLIRSFLPPLEGDKRLPGLSGGTEPLELACLDTLEMEELLGVNRQTIRLLLALLEKTQLLTYGSISYMQATISFHKRPAAEVAAQYSAISQALAVGRPYGGKWTFGVPLVARQVGVEPSQLVQVLRRLEVTGDISVEFKKDCMCFKLHRGVDDDELPLLAASVAAQCRDIQACELHKLQCIYEMLYRDSSPTFALAKGVQSSLSAYISKYYEDESVHLWPGLPIPTNIAAICSDIMGEFSYPPDEKDIACVLMAIRTAKVKREQWNQQSYWGLCAECDFLAVLDVADLFLRNQLGPDTGLKRVKES
jgi:ATP-dependent DNA helicase Q4